MIRVAVIQQGNRYAIVAREGIKYKVPIEVLVFGGSPTIAYIHPKELTAARIIDDED